LRYPERFERLSRDDGEAEVLVLDTSAFIAGYGVPESSEVLYTVPGVKDEVKAGGLQRLRLENAEKMGVLTVLLPGEEYRNEVKRVFEEMGEAGVLSDADIQILSLGLQLKYEGKKTVIVSDDYAVQNVADRLGLGIKSLVTPGIKRRYRWITYLKRRPSTEKKIE
jgi:UPF0271 protein